MSFAQLVLAVDRATRRHLGGVDVVYAPAVGLPVTVVGMFSDPFELAAGEPLAGVEALGPSVHLTLSDLPIDPEHDEPTLTIGGIAYRVSGPREPDGMGGIVLRLRKAG